MLSTTDISHFKTYGFVMLPGYLDTCEVDALRDEVIGNLEAAYADTPFDGTARHWVPLLSPRAPFLCELAEDGRFFAAAEQFVGSGAVLFMADANRYVGDTGWHTDGVYPGVKYMLYLDPVDADTGALRVIPGSHNPAYSEDIRTHFKDQSPDQRAIPAHVCRSQPGDVLAFDYRLWHASFGGGNDRRLCTIEYYQPPQGADHAQAIREHVSTIARSTAQLWPRRDFPFYDNEWVADVGRSPERQELVERMRAVGVFQAAEEAVAG